MFSCFSISNDASSRRLSSPTPYLLSRPESKFEFLWQEKERLFQHPSNATAASSPPGFERVRMFTGNGVVWINSPEEMEAFQAQYFPPEGPLSPLSVDSDPSTVKETEEADSPPLRTGEPDAEPTANHHSPVIEDPGFGVLADPTSTAFPLQDGSRNEVHETEEVSDTQAISNHDEDHKNKTLVSIRKTQMPNVFYLERWLFFILLRTPSPTSQPP